MLSIGLVQNIAFLGFFSSTLPCIGERCNFDLSREKLVSLRKTQEELYNERKTEIAHELFDSPA